MMTMTAHATYASTRRRAARTTAQVETPRLGPGERAVLAAGAIVVALAIVVPPNLPRDGAPQGWAATRHAPAGAARTVAARSAGADARP